MKKQKGLSELFLEKLQMIYSAEKQQVKNLPRLAKASQNDDLRAALQHHLEETKAQVGRIEQVFKSIGQTPKTKSGIVVAAMVEHSGLSLNRKDLAQPDELLIADAQEFEHHEIACYGTLQSWAKSLGYNDAVGLFEASLQEEKNADKKLSEIAEQQVRNASEIHRGNE